MKKFNFKNLIIVLLLALVISPLASCESAKELSAPLDFTINESVISFSSVEGATKYRAVFTSQTNVVMKRFVNSGDDINSLNIPEGIYSVAVQAMNDSAESALSNTVEYKQKDLYMVKSIEKEALIDGNYIKWMGRTSYNQTTCENTMYYSAAGFEVNVKKDEEPLTASCVITGTNTSDSAKRPYIVLVLDDNFDNVITIALSSQSTVVNLIGNDGYTVTDDEVHKVSLYKRSESIDSHIALKSIETNGKFVSGVSYKERKIEVIAASSSTGYGNLSNTTKTTSNSDCLNAFAFLSARSLNSEINIVSASGWGISASRWTSPNTINMHDQYKYVDVFSNELWDTTRYTPDVIVTNFGTNDSSYIEAATTPSEKAKRTENFIATYVDFLNNLHKTYPSAKIIILYGLMLESKIYDNTVEIYNRALELIPDLAILKVQGDAKGYNSHPSVASHKLIAVELTNKIKEVTGWE